MRYDAEHKARTRTTLLAEAAKAIRSEGPHKVGVAEIMARAGLTHGGFYAHFESKDALIAAAIATMFKESLVAFERGTSGPGPARALDAYISTYLSERHRDARETGCPLAALAADVPRPGTPATRPSLRRCPTNSRPSTFPSLRCSRARCWGKWSVRCRWRGAWLTPGIRRGSSPHPAMVSASALACARVGPRPRAFPGAR
jgi:AcrR family transcriptional regulator